MENGFTYDRLVDLLNYLMRNALLLGGFLATGAIVFYGFQMVMAKDDAGKFSTSKGNLIKAAIGALLIFGAYTIIWTVRGAAQTLTQ